MVVTFAPNQLTTEVKSVRCTTNLFLKLCPETMLVSTSRTCQLRTSREDMSALITRTSQLLVFRISLHRSLFSTILAKCPTDTALSWTVTLHILRASSPRSRRRLIVVQVSPPRIIPSSSSLVMLPLSSLFQANLCVLKLSPSILLLEGLLFVT